VPLPSSFVVKKGSNIFSFTAASNYKAPAEPKQDDPRAQDIKQSLNSVPGHRRLQVLMEQDVGADDPCCGEQQVISEHLRRPL
jgi:hypothetical protein